MEFFKIESLLRKNPGALPPQFASLTEDQEREVIDRLLSSAGRPEGPPQVVLTHILQQSKPLAGVDLDKQEIDLSQVFEKCGVVPRPTIYVEWGPLREIDRFQTEDLIKHFYDVWYPSADDIELFDETFSWIVFVRHFGGVQVWRPSSSGA
ncbi:hypothetical protein [Paludibaculum fermentans]|uniref:hypothetical protein n=1 Tax=Paludibaculum fermentans TaxID=1473598 RepID=UPI003EBAE701